jgi:hypothetical protein
LTKRHGDPDLRIFVVWEPVLPSDRGPPSASVQARLPDDPRVRRFWDAGRLVSGALLEAARARHDPKVEGHGVVWDLVCLYPAGKKLEEEPAWAGGPVADRIEELEKVLSGRAGSP